MEMVDSFREKGFKLMMDCTKEVQSLIDDISSIKVTDEEAYSAVVLKIRLKCSLTSADIYLLYHEALDKLLKEDTLDNDGKNNVFYMLKELYEHFEKQLERACSISCANIQILMGNK